MVLKGQPGETYLLQKGWSNEYEVGKARDSGIIRDDEGRSYGGAYEVVSRKDECDNCGGREFEVMEMNAGAVLVCSGCQA